MGLAKEIRQQLMVYQRNEITEHHIYTMLAKVIKSPENRRVLETIAADEFRHYHDWGKHTQQDVPPDRLKVWYYYVISRVLGLTFGVKLMERGEESAQQTYAQLVAAFSMGASEYLSTRSEKTTKNPVRASIYTGVAYIVTVLALILPYLVLENYYVCLALTLLAAVLVIGFFNYYISVAMDEPFRARFLEMTGLSLGVAALSFCVGFLMRTFFGIDV